jgi:hypothetical protein
VLFFCPLRLREQYDSLCAHVKSLVGVKVLEPGEEPPINCVASGRCYIMPASLRAFMEVKIVAVLIIGNLERLEAADHGSARMDLAAGRFVLVLVIRPEDSGVERGHTFV